MASGKHPPAARNVRPITKSGISIVAPKTKIMFDKFYKINVPCILYNYFHV